MCNPVLLVRYTSGSTPYELHPVKGGRFIKGRSLDKRDWRCCCVVHPWVSWVRWVKANLVRLWCHNLFKSTRDSSCASVIGSSPSSYTTVIASRLTHGANSLTQPKVHIPIRPSQGFPPNGTKDDAPVLPLAFHS